MCIRDSNVLCNIFAYKSSKTMLYKLIEKIN